KNVPMSYLNNLTSKHSCRVACCRCAWVFALPSHRPVFVMTGRTVSIDEDHCIIPLPTILLCAISFFRILRPKLRRPPAVKPRRTNCSIQLRESIVLVLKQKIHLRTIIPGPCLAFLHAVGRREDHPWCNELPSACSIIFFPVLFEHFVVQHQAGPFQWSNRGVPAVAFRRSLDTRIIL